MVRLNLMRRSFAQGGQGRALYKFFSNAPETKKSQVLHDDVDSRSKKLIKEQIEHEVSVIANQLREEIVESTKHLNPELAWAVRYYFEKSEWEKFRPSTELLMASALTPFEGLRVRTQRIIKSSEMIHVSVFSFDDILTLAETRRGIKSLNSIVGDKCAVRAGNILYSQAINELVQQLKSLQVAALFTQVKQNLHYEQQIRLEGIYEDLRSMESYLNTMRNETALLATSCKAIAILAEKPVLEYVGKSRAIEKVRQLAQEHADRAKEAISAVPDCVLRYQTALIDLPDLTVNRSK